MSADGRLTKGRRAEDQIADALLARGWTLLGRRCRTPHGELDLVALDGETLVIVEVKFRREGDPAEAVTLRKRHRLRRAANEFAAEYGLATRERRFDIAAVAPDGWRLIEGVEVADADDAGASEDEGDSLWV